jgi:hypothetical protein
MEGADPFRLSEQIREFGDDFSTMPAIFVANKAIGPKQSAVYDMEDEAFLEAAKENIRWRNQRNTHKDPKNTKKTATGGSGPT